jgi:hypothetical protein
MTLHLISSPGRSQIWPRISPAVHPSRRCTWKHFRPVDVHHTTTLHMPMFIFVICRKVCRCSVLPSGYLSQRFRNALKINYKWGNRPLGESIEYLKQLLRKTSPSRVPNLEFPTSYLFCNLPLPKG